MKIATPQLKQKKAMYPYSVEIHRPSSKSPSNQDFVLSWDSSISAVEVSETQFCFQQ